jgi:hypothetical protein
MYVPVEFAASQAVYAVVTCYAVCLDTSASMYQHVLVQHDLMYAKQYKNVHVAFAK